MPRERPKFDWHPRPGLPNPSPALTSIEVDATVYIHNFARHVACLGRGQEESGIGDVFRLPAPTRWCGVADSSVELALLVGADRFGRDAGENKSRRNRIARDPVGAKLSG